MAKARSPHPRTAPCLNCKREWTMSADEARKCRGWKKTGDSQWCFGEHSCPSCRAEGTVELVRAVAFSEHYDEEERIKWIRIWLGENELDRWDGETRIMEEPGVMAPAKKLVHDVLEGRISAEEYIQRSQE